MRMIAITGTIKKGRLELSADPSLFPEGTEVILLARNDWDVIAGSDSTRYQLDQAKEEVEKVRGDLKRAQDQIDQIVRDPEKAKEIIGDLGVRK